MDSNEFNFPVETEIVTEEVKPKKKKEKVKLRRASNLRNGFYVVQETKSKRYYRLPEQYVSDVGKQEFYEIDLEEFEKLEEN